MYPQYKKHIFFFVSLFFICTLLLLACQPTPDISHMANRSEGLDEALVIEALPKGNKKEIDTPTQWTEHLERRKGAITIEADASVIVPEISNTPILEFQQAEFTQERLEELVHYFVEEAALYAPSLPTRIELEQEDKKMSDKSGVYAAPWFWDGDITKMRNKIKKMLPTAPIIPTKEPIEITFTVPEQTVKQYIRDIEPKSTQKAETMFAAFADDKDNALLTRSISASKYDENSGAVSEFFYSRGDIYTEKDILYDKDTIMEYSSWIGTAMEALTPIDKTWIANLQNKIDDFEKQTNKISLDLNWAKEQAKQTLSDLGIEGMGLAATYVGMQFPKHFNVYSDILQYDLKEANEGYSFVYFREIDGLLSCILENEMLAVNSTEELVAPPFFPECITIFVTKDGVQSFHWENMSQPVGVIAENTDLLPFDVIKEKFADHMNYFTGNIGETEELYLVKSVELRSTYATAYNNPTHAVIIPVWVFEYDRISTYDTELPEQTIKYLNKQFQMSALDGGHICAAGGMYSTKE